MPELEIIGPTEPEAPLFELEIIGPAIPPPAPAPVPLTPAPALVNVPTDVPPASFDPSVSGPATGGGVRPLGDRAGTSLAGQAAPVVAAPAAPVGPSAAKDLWDRSFGYWARNLWRGVLGSQAGAYDFAGNLVELANKATEALGGEVAFPDLPSRAHAYAQKIADYAPKLEEVDEHFVGRVLEGLGAAPQAIAEYATASKALRSGVAGFAALDAARAANEGWKEALTAGIKGALLGKAFEGTAGLSRTAKVPALATLGGGMAAAEPGASVKDIAVGATTLGALGAMHRGPVGIRQARRRFVESFKEPEPIPVIPREEPYLGRPSQEVEPTPEPGLPAAPTPEAPVEAPAAPAPAGRLDALAKQVHDALHPGLKYDKARDGAWWRAKTEAVLNAPRTVEGVIEATVNEPRMIEKALAKPSEVQRAQKVLDILPQPEPAPAEAPAPKAQAPELTIIGPAPAEAPVVSPEIAAKPVVARETPEAVTQTEAAKPPSEEQIRAGEEELARRESGEQYEEPDMPEAVEAAREKAIDEQFAKDRKKALADQEEADRLGVPEWAHVSTLAPPHPKGGRDIDKVFDVIKRQTGKQIWGDLTNAEKLSVYQELGGKPLKPITEATAQGEQVLVPGVAPVTAKEKAEAKGRGVLRGGRDPFEGTPLGDVSGRGQLDLVEMAKKAPEPAKPGKWVAKKESQATTGKIVNHRYTVTAPDGQEFPVNIPSPKASPLSVKEITHEAIVRGQMQYTAKELPKEKKRRVPTKAVSLAAWVKSKGGVRKFRGELTAQGITPKSRPGIINNKTGMYLDDAALEAWEAGYFPEHTERPTVHEFIDALRADLRGESRRYTPEDADLLEQQAWEDQVVEAADRLGIKVAGRNLEDVATEIEGLPAGAYGMQVALPPRPSRIRGYEAGARYKGFRPEEKEPVEPPKGKKPLDREAVLAPLLKDLGIPIYQGGMKGRKVLGFYRPKVEEVRIKRFGDVEVAAHELAHFLDKRFPEIRKQWLPAKKANKDIRDELRGVSYDKKKLFEGFAEFVRLWATQPTEAKKRAPHFNAWWEGFLDRSPHGKALRNAKKGFLAWFEQEGILRAKSKVGLNEDINAGLDSTSGRFRQWALDDLQGILTAENTMFGAQQELGAYETGRLTRSAQSIVYGALKFGAPKMMSDGRFAFVDAHGNSSAIYETDKKGRPRIKPNPEYKPWGLENILKPVADNLEDYGMYAIGRRAAHLKKEGRERLFTNAEIRAMLALETPARAKAFADWNVFNSQTLDFAQQGGVINRASRRQWETDVYLPFWRVTQQGPAGAKALGGIPGAMKLIRRLHGGTANLQDPILNMIQNTRMMIEAAIYNHAKVAIVDKIAQKQGGARFLTKIPRENKAVKIDTEQVERAFWESIGVNYKMLKSGMLPAEIDPQFATLIQQGFAQHGDFMQFMLRGQAPQPGSDIQAIMRDGKAHYYQVADNLLLRSMQSLPRQIKTHPMISILKGIKGLGQRTVTLALDFMARNIFRDQIMAATLSRHGYKPFISAAKGLKHRLAEDAVYQEYLANGGGVATFMSTETGLYKDLERFYKKHNIAYELVVNTPRKMLRMLETLADATEMATRLGYFEKALSKGEQPRKAAFLSRDISTDFAKRGDSQALGFLYDTVMFLKAGVIGVDRVYQGFTRDPNRAKVATATAGLALASVGLWALNYGNPLYDDLADWEKDTFWHFFIPKPGHLKTWLETGKLPDIPEEELYEHFRLPKAWEIGGIASIAERTFEVIVTGEGKEYAKHILKIIRDMFRFEYLPQAIRPMAEVSANRLFFFDRPIETMADEGLEPWARAGRASRTLRALGEKVTRHLPRGLQLSPAKMEALLRGYLNAWAGYGLTLSDQVFFDDSPDLRVDQYPLFKSFYRKQPRRSSRYTTEFWDMLRAATEARRTARLMIRKERPGIADELIYGKPGEATVENLEYGRLHGAEGIMRNLIKTQRMVADAGTLKKVQSLAEEYAKAMRQRGIIGRFKVRGYWRDIGALKSELLDEIGKAKRNVAKLAVQDIKRIRKTEPTRGQKLRQETIRRYGTSLPGVR